MDDTRTKTPEEIEAEKNSTMPSEDLNPVPVDTAPRAPKKQKTRSKFTTSNVSVEAAGQAYLDGKITKDEWSRATPALRKSIERWAKKHKRDKKVEVESKVENE